MKLPISLLTVMLTLSLAGAAQVDDDAKDEKDEIAKLQGLWQVVKFVDHGLVSASEEELAGQTFEFQGQKVILRKEKDDPGRLGSFTIDVSRKPKWINIDFGRASKGIYKIEGDELTLCVVGGMRGGKETPRPTAFKASMDPPHALFVLRRVK